MSQAQRLENLSQEAREALIGAMSAKAATDATTYVDTTGDTMTGTLEVPSFISTGAATIAGPTNFVNIARMGGLALASAASLTGNMNITGVVKAGTIALTSSASITGLVNMGGVITSAGTINATGVINLDSNATLATPLIAGFGSVIAGPTIAPIRVIASGASQAFFDFRGAVISTASLSLTAGTVAGLVQVWIDGVAGKAIGYMPIFRGVV